MIKVNIYDAKARFSKLLKDVEEKDEKVIICRNGKPVADLVNHRTVSGILKPKKSLSGARFIGDPCAGVDSRDWPEDLR